MSLVVTRLLDGAVTHNVMGYLGVFDATEDSMHDTYDAIQCTGDGPCGMD